MNISYNWLKDLIDLDLFPADAADRLTKVGLAVEGIHSVGADHVLDIDLTSNRPDCLSHLGVARELAAITGSPLKFLPAGRHSPANNQKNLVTLKDDDICPRFTAQIIRNVKVGPSPPWLMERLEAIGERSINNIADITNYVMHELGQPMHSFDLDRLKENRIIVRRALAGETITTLDEVDRTLDSSMLAICDAAGPVAIAGIMGGLDSSISESTVNVLLEVAYFNRDKIRATSRKLCLSTEASYRFERGVDIENVVNASVRATELIIDLAGGMLGEYEDIYPSVYSPNTIEAKRLSESVKRLTGLNVSGSDCNGILERLGIKRQQETVYLSPSWRHDLAIEEDLVEEVARHAGYHKIGTELPPAFGAGEYQPTEIRERRLRVALADLGLNEAISYSFIDTRFDDVFDIVPGIEGENATEKHVTLQDSVIEGAVRMRPSLLPGLLEAVRLNLNHHRRDIKLFELGKVFAGRSAEDELPNEQELLAIVMTGREAFQGRVLATRELDFYDAKGAIEAALEAAGVEGVTFQQKDVKHLQRGQSAEMLVGGRAVGYLGRLSDEIAVSFKFKQPVYLAELNLTPIIESNSARVGYQPLPKYPSIVRDVSFLADRRVTFAQIRDAVIEQQFDICRGVTFVDVYENKDMSGALRSITVRLEYRSDTRTLIEDEVEATHTQIVGKTIGKLGISTRV
ncbi:MAG: phenylalanine--tRNA ligase subunit beta [Pyrinomonadaceae bacterium]